MTSVMSLITFTVIVNIDLSLHKNTIQSLGKDLFFLNFLNSKSRQAINAGEGVEKREVSYTVGGNAN